VAIVCAVTVVELYPRDLPSRPDVPDVYERIAADSSDAAVLELPVKFSTTQAQVGFEGHDEDFMYLLYAIAHEHPIVSGAVSRYPDDDLAELLRVPVYRQLLALGGEPGFEEPAEFDEGDLADLGIGFVVYHRDDPDPRVRSYIEALDLPVLADDGTVIIWTVDP
jgi:hypothetical protein